MIICLDSLLAVSFVCGRRDMKRQVLLPSLLIWQSCIKLDGEGMVVIWTYMAVCFILDSPALSPSNKVKMV